MKRLLSIISMLTCLISVNGQIRTAYYNNSEHGDSMINIGIHNGDQVIVASTPTAENGDVVVAMIDNEATVKTFYKEKGHYRLQPENDAMDPIIVKECTILGKVVGLFRIF